jgi:hypothetical protein
MGIGISLIQLKSFIFVNNKQITALSIIIENVLAEVCDNPEITLRYGGKYFINVSQGLIFGENAKL